MSRVRHESLTLEGGQVLDLEVKSDSVDVFRFDTLVARAEQLHNGDWWVNVREDDGGWPPITRSTSSRDLAVLRLGLMLADRIL